MKEKRHLVYFNDFLSFVSPDNLVTIRNMLLSLGISRMVIALSHPFHLDIYLNDSHLSHIFSKNINLHFIVWAFRIVLFLRLFLIGYFFFRYPGYKPLIPQMSHATQPICWMIPNTKRFRMTKLNRKEIMIKERS